MMKGTGRILGAGGNEVEQTKKMHTTLLGKSTAEQKAGLNHHLFWPCLADAAAMLPRSRGSDQKYKDVLLSAALMVMYEMFRVICSMSHSAFAA